MATRKPNVLARKREYVILVAGFAVFLIVVAINLIRFANPPKDDKDPTKQIPFSQADVDRSSKAYEDWYNKERKTKVEVRPAEDQAGLLRSMTQEYGKPLNTDTWLFHTRPYIHLPRQKEDAFFIGKAVLTAEPGFNTVKVTVRFSDIENEKTFQAVSPTTKNLEDYPHLPPDRLDVKIFRGVKTPDGTVTWGEQPYEADPSTTEPGVFVWPDKDRIKGVTDLFYKAEVQSKEPFIDAAKLTADVLPVAEQEPPVPALTLKGEEVLPVTTLAPWSVAILQTTWDETSVTVTVTDLNTNKQKNLGALKVGDEKEKIGDTTYRLINIINAQRFLITVRGNITKIDLAMSVINPGTGGKLVAVPNTVWEADPLAPPADNAAIIDAYVKQVFAELQKVAPVMGGGEFDYENNFIANILWRAVATFPPEPAGKLTDAFGRDVQQYEYKAEGEANPVKLVPYVFTDEVEANEVVILHIFPSLADGKAKYWVEYSKKGADNKITTAMSGPYQVTLPRDFDMSPANKDKRLIEQVLSPDVRARKKAKTFEKATENPGLTAVGPVPLYDRTLVIDARGSDTGDDLGIKAKLGAPLALVIQYVDTNIPSGAKLLEAPTIPREKFVRPLVAPPAAATAEDNFTKRLAGRLVLGSRTPEYANIEEAAKYVESSSGIKVILDQSVKFKGWDAVKLTLQLDDPNVSVNDFVTKLVEAFNKDAADNTAVAGRKLVREDRPSTGEIVLKMQ